MIDKGLVDFGLYLFARIYIHVYIFIYPEHYWTWQNYRCVPFERMWADNEHDAINECLHDSGEFKCYMFFHTHTRPPKEWYKCQKNGKMQWKKGDVLYKPAQSEFNTKIFLQGVLFDILKFVVI